MQYCERSDFRQTVSGNLKRSSNVCANSNSFFFFSSNNLFDPYDQNFQHCIFRKKKEFLNSIHFFFFLKKNI